VDLLGVVLTESRTGTKKPLSSLTVHRIQRVQIVVVLTIIGHHSVKNNLGVIPCSLVVIYQRFGSHCTGAFPAVHTPHTAHRASHEDGGSPLLQHFGIQLVNFRQRFILVFWKC
jgi:hypothetical protein